MYPKIKKDKFRKSRGGTSILYKIICSGCGFHVLTYQKDGIGTLHRLYIDRIVNRVDNSKNLICKRCTKLVGIPMIYKPENRDAFRLVPGSITKVKIK